MLDKMKDMNRRDVLKMGLTGMLAASVPFIGIKDAKAYTNGGQWRVSFHHQHSGEKFSGVYRVGDQYIPQAFERINYVLRDFRTGEIFPMDPHVIDIISMVQGRIRNGKSIEVLSGYRSPRTNAMLRGASTRVAKNSYHMYGQALDIRIPDCSTVRVRDTARAFRAGGVGYYPRSNFVHVDTGDVRHW